MGSRGIAVLAAALLVVTACSGDDDDTTSPKDRAIELAPVHAVRGDRPGIFDESGRQVVLRGVNLNNLGEYARNDPDLDPTQHITPQTWRQMADEGFNVVRLLVSWSKLQPERGKIDQEYVDEIRAAVRGAAAQGVYTVIDMHQDAWGPYVATPDSVTCPAGKEPSNGWDGAPEWATPAAGVNSCRGAGGEAKPGSDLVVEAWNRFYDDTDGIQTELVSSWRQLVEALGDEPSIAGYDILNEPGYGSGANGATGLIDPMPALGDFYAEAIAGIRKGEDAAGVEARPIFFEHAVGGNPPPPDFSDDPGLVFAPHLYGGSIAGFITVDQGWDVMLSLADGFDTSIWAGEYGWWDDPAADPETLARVRRFAEREDGGGDDVPWVPVGSAWWQWNNGCGDPHQITSPGAGAPEEIRQYRVTACVDGEAVDKGVVPEWHEVLGRPAVRFAPGWITSVRSDGKARSLTLQAEDAKVGAQVELWVPGDDRPDVGGNGIGRPKVARSHTGWLVTAKVSAATYEVTVT